MNDEQIEIPKNYKSIEAESKSIGFTMPSDLQTGSLLRTLVASKPGGKFLELGTGTGLSLSWIVESMDSNSKVISIDNGPAFIEIAQSYFGDDERVEILCEDGGQWIMNNLNKKMDLIFADAWPGKYDTLEETLSLIKPGGLYVIDDMLAQPNWPEGHEEKAANLISYLESRPDFRMTKINWSTGIVVATKLA